MSNTKEKEVLLYDIKSFPDHYFGLTPEQVIKIYKEERIVLWDSSEGGKEPKIFLKDEELPEPFIIDVSSTQLSESTQKKIKRALKDE